MYKFKLITSRLSILPCSIVLFTAFCCFLSSCFEETFESNIDIEIGTSVDTLRFDTVFTSVGSVTKAIVVYNRSNQNVNITSIRLEKGSQSMFRLNVDGIPGSEALEVPILAGDSLYLFVEVTVDPDQPLSLSPYIIDEKLLITTGVRDWVVTLEAWGQNANYFPSRDAQGQIIGLTCQNGSVVWDDPKPYVVYGLLFIDSCSLVIAPGTEVFVHGGLARVEDIIFGDGGLFFLANGNLRSQGTVDQPIVFQGDRLEEDFSDQSGQWAGLRFLNESKDNLLEHTEIRNSTVGIRVDSAASVELKSVIIANTSNVGLIGIHGAIKADNSLIHSNGPQSIAMIYGGDYEYRYCTIANYENQASAVFMDNFVCLNEECSAVATNPLNVRFENSIIMGSNDDELNINDASEGADPDLLNLVFDHTLIKVDESKMDYREEACLNCLEHDGEPVFLDQFNDDYSLDTMSVARSQGVPIMDVPLDILGLPRDAMTPDIGCFEFKE